MTKTMKPSQREVLAGAATLSAMALAFILVNSPLDWLYTMVHHTPVSVQVGTLIIDKPLIQWINKGLMVFFFLLVGLEIKREVLQGQLSSPTRLALPGLAALGGMLLPAIIYVFFNASDPSTLRGWAVPTATDIVLALAVLSLLGDRIPVSLKVFLTALAIFDDLGAILIIALFYSEGISGPALILAAVAIVALLGLNLCNVTRRAAYVIVGLFLWLAVLKSGVHATLAGVVIAWSIPLRGGGKDSPLYSLERGLHPWVAFGVVPVFAFFNAGLAIAEMTVSTLSSPISLGVMLGLFVGKQAGVFGSAWLAIRLGLAERPKDASWLQLYGVSLLAGIGFTMSLFIGSLAFSDLNLARSLRLSILLGSLSSALIGLAVLYFGSRRH